MLQIPTDLKSILQNLKTRKYTPLEVKRLVLICSGIAESALMSYHRRTAELLHSYGWNIQDLAVDCIGELFACEANGTLIKFQPIFEGNDLNPEGLSDTEVFLILKAFVNKFVSYRLREVLSEVDPEGRRISRNIREALRNRKSQFRLACDFRGEILCCPDEVFGSDNTQVVRDDLPGIPYHELELLVFSKITKAGSIAETLDDIASLLSAQKRYRHSVRLIDIVQILKKLYATLFFLEIHEEEQDQPIDLSSLEKSHFVGLRQSTLELVAKSILDTYYHKKKLDRSEAEALLNMMSSLLDDWLEGVETDHNYFKYAVRNLQCSKEVYEERWSSMVHYMVKIMRTHLRERISGTY